MFIWPFIIRPWLAVWLLVLLLITACAGERKERPSVYVALGASDVVGVGADNPSLENWPALVHGGLPDGTQFVNLGISGATLQDVIEQQLPIARDAGARWISIWPGVNDLRARVKLATFARQLETVLGQLREEQSPAPVLIVLNIPDLSRLPAFAGVDASLLDGTVHEWNSTIAAVAARHDALLIDLYAENADLIEHPEFISSDGFHSSTEGYRRIADRVLAELTQHAPTTLQ